MNLDEILKRQEREIESIADLLEFLAHEGENMMFFVSDYYKMLTVLNKILKHTFDTYYELAKIANYEIPKKMWGICLLIRIKAYDKTEDLELLTEEADKFKEELKEKIKNGPKGETE